MAARVCGLCQNRASVYCPSDDAFLCWSCDGSVHEANFLVARHLRSVLCCQCFRPTVWQASGSRFPPIADSCSDCMSGGLKTDLDSLPIPKQCESKSVSSDSCSSVVSDGCSEEASLQEDKNRGVDPFRDAAASFMSLNAQVGVRKAHILKHLQSSKTGSVKKNVGTESLNASMENVLRRWQKDLGLSSANVVFVAMSLFRKMSKMMKMDETDKAGLLVSLGACLWMACRLYGCKKGSMQMAEFQQCTGVPESVLVVAELLASRLLQRKSRTPHRVH